jgi:flagellin
MISINVNSAASASGLNLGKTNDALQKSLQRLSSGSRIVNSSDDAGGLAVSMKMSAALKRTEATAINLSNVQSFLQTQDGAFKVASNVLTRMSELSTLARDVTKNDGDRANYDKEFQNLQTQITSLSTEKFNGVSLFSNTPPNGSTFVVPTSEDGSQTTSVTQSSIAHHPLMNMMINGFAKVGNNFIELNPGSPPTPTGVAFNSAGASSSATEVEIAIANAIIDGTNNYLNPPGNTDSITAVVSSTDIANSSVNSVLNYNNSDEYSNLSQLALQQLADMRAQNGAESSRVSYSQDLLKINALNLEAANSRIIDVDVAAESTQLARYQILQQAGTAMLAQANTSQQSLVRLLQG